MAYTRGSNFRFTLSCKLSLLLFVLLRCAYLEDCFQKWVTNWLAGWQDNDTTIYLVDGDEDQFTTSPAAAARSRTLGYNSSSHNSTDDDDEICWPSSARNKKLSTLCTQRRNGYLGRTGCRSHHGKVRTHRRIHSEYPMVPIPGPGPHLT